MPTIFFIGILVLFTEAILTINHLVFFTYVTNSEINYLLIITNFNYVFGIDSDILLRLKRNELDNIVQR